MDHANLSCVLKVDPYCHSCKMHTFAVLSTINGLYDVTMNGEEQRVNIYAEVNPNLLMTQLARPGHERHAQIIWVKLNHPKVDRAHYNYNNSDYLYHGENYRYPRHGYIEMAEPSWRRRALPEYSSYHPNNYYYGTTTLPSARYIPSYPAMEYPYVEEQPMGCSIM